MPPRLVLFDEPLCEAAVLDVVEQRLHRRLHVTSSRCAARRHSRPTPPCLRSSAAYTPFRRDTAGRRSASVRATPRSTPAPADNPASTSVSNPAFTSAVVPPHSTACSPKRSVSVSSVNVVSSTPARVQPMPLRVAQRQCERMAGLVLLDRDQRWDAAALCEHLTHTMSRCLGRNQ